MLIDDFGVRVHNTSAYHCTPAIDARRGRPRRSDCGQKTRELVRIGRR